MMDYARLIHAAWDEGGLPVEVFGPAPISLITQGYFGPDGVMSHDLRARTGLTAVREICNARDGSVAWPMPKVTEITPDFVFVGTGWRLSTCEVPHAQPALECLAFALESEDRKLVYSGDAGICDALKALAEGADTLLHWCYRLDGEQAEPDMLELMPTPGEIGVMAKTVGVKRLLLTHIRMQMDAPDRHAAAVDALRDSFGTDSGIVEDLDIFEI